MTQPLDQVTKKGETIMSQKYTVMTYDIKIHVNQFGFSRYIETPINELEIVVKADNGEQAIKLAKDTTLRDYARITKVEEL